MARGVLGPGIGMRAGRVIVCNLVVCVLSQRCHCRLPPPSNPTHPTHLLRLSNTPYSFLSLLTRCSSHSFCAPQDTLAGSPSNTAATVEGLKYLRAPGGN